MGTRLPDRESSPLSPPILEKTMEDDASEEEVDVEEEEEEE